MITIILFQYRSSEKQTGISFQILPCFDMIHVLHQGFYNLSLLCSNPMFTCMLVCMLPISSVTAGPIWLILFLLALSWSFRPKKFRIQKILGSIYEYLLLKVGMHVLDNFFPNFLSLDRPFLVAPK